MAELSEATRGVLLSSMSPATAGMMLGRSAAWVERQRREMAEPLQRSAGQVIDPAELDPLPDVSGGARSSAASRTSRPDAPKAEPSRAEPSRAEPSRAEPSRKAVARAAKRVKRGIPAASRSSALRALAAARRPRVPTRREAAQTGVQRMKPVTPAIVRWAGWFLDARWPLSATAGLFDVDPDALLTALETA